MLKSILALSATLLFQFSANSQSYSFDWVNTHGNPNGNDEAKKIVTDSQNNVYVAGYFRDTVDFDPGTGIFELTSPNTQASYIQKLDAEGNLIWAKKIQNGGSITINSIILDELSNIIVGGKFFGTATFTSATVNTSITSGASFDAFVLKFDNDCEILWAKSFGNSAEEDILYDLTVDSDGNVYSTGIFSKTIDFDPGSGTFSVTSSSNSQDVFIHKLSADGDFSWAKKIGNSGFDEGVDIVFKNSQLFITGWFQNTVDFDPSSATFIVPGVGSSDVFLLSLLENGDFNWAKAFGSVYTDKGVGSVLDENGNIYLTATYDNEIDVDPGTGTVLLPAPGSTSFFVVKLDALGEYVWAQPFTGTSTVYSTAIAVHPSNGIVVGGMFVELVDFDPGAGTNVLHGQGEADVFLVQLDDNGNYVWAGSFGNVGSPYNDLLRDVHIDLNGDLYAGGRYNYLVDFDPGQGTHPVDDIGWGDIFVLKLKFSNVSVAENSLHGLVVYPNPARDRITIKLDKIKSTKLKIYDMSGVIVREKELVTGTSDIEIHDLASGSYLLEVTSGSEAVRQLIIKQ